MLTTETLLKRQTSILEQIIVAAWQNVARRVQVGADTLYDCSVASAESAVNQTCLAKRCLQEGKEVHCTVDCEVQVHTGICSGQDDGSGWIFDVENNGAYSKLYYVKAPAL
ncbi:hypothetical protein BGZ52_012468, partial [Haplosporangium bisporale]